jgi:hypothetical protein
MKNNILIVAMNKDWIGISRLPSGLSRAGFMTYALCPRGSYLSYTKYLAKTILYPTFTYSRSKIIYLFVLYAILKFRPDMIIPGDEEAIVVLHRLNYFFLKIPFLKKYTVIRNSLPSREFDKMIFSKSTFVENCKKWGVSVPRNVKVDSVLKAKEVAAEMGYPIVIKLDVGYGGSGVFVCQNEDDLVANVISKQNPSFLTRFKFKLRNLFFISILDTGRIISIQQYVKGMAGHISFCALDGKLLAANPMLAIKTFPGSTGPSSVSQGFNNHLLFQFAKIVTEKLCYNGFGSLDFLLEEKTNKIYVIELNSRPTPPCHFSSEVVTHDLCSILYKTINQIEVEMKTFKPFTVAMFPNEKRRDPESPFLTEAYHDIPHDDESLLNAFLM